MKWVSAISLETSLEDARQDCVAKIRQGLAGVAPDLLFLFVSPHHHAEFDDLPAGLMAELKAHHLIGCTGAGIIGDGREMEQQPALSLTAALLPGVELCPFHLEGVDLPEEIEAHQLAERLDTGPDPLFLLFPDPFSIEAERLIRLLDLAFPGAPKIGGLASGGRGPGRHDLFLGDRIYHTGTVGLAASGNIRLDAIVAQGCRPIGQPMFITRCRDNILHELNGTPPRQVLRELYDSLAEKDRDLFRHSLFLGIEMTLKEEAYGQGDFLIRNIFGVDPEEGYLEIGAGLRETAVAQFHLRDAETSREDLENHLRRYDQHAAGPPISGALLFSCLGRGRGLYGVPNHDADLLRKYLGPIPLAGFFCNGEIGPVKGLTYLHTYTSSFGLIGPRE